MKRKINNSLLVTATLAILATVLLTVAVCYNLLRQQVVKDLAVSAEMLKGYLNEINLDMLPEDTADANREMEARIKEQLFPALKEVNRKIRVTVVLEDGTVLFDSEADAEEMGNHRNRPEIQKALKEGSGSEIRKSETLDENTYYYALLLQDGMVLRISCNADSIFKVMEYAVPYLTAIVAVLIVLCAVSAYFLSERIIRPVRLIAENADNVDHVVSYEEMKPFIEAIRRQHDDVLENAKLRQEFTANVSHELKTPLTAISGYAELVENGMVADEKEVRRFCGEIHKSAGRLLTLINDVIRLSELDDEASQEVLEQVNLLDAAKNSVNMLQFSAQKHHVTLSVRGENVIIMANKQMLDEVLYNLCDNAIRYNKEDGIVEVIVEDRLNEAKLIVKDTGIGIPKEHQERIFERFYRVDKSRSKSTGGTGLGLAIVKHILLKLNAEIALRSEPDRGTEITVTFQAVKDAKFYS